MPGPTAAPFPAAVADPWAVFVFATMVYDANRARMHAMVEACARLGFEAVYVESPNSNSRYHGGTGAPSLNAGGWRVAPPETPHRLPNGTGVLCVPKKRRIGPLRIGGSHRAMERAQAAWLRTFFLRYRAQTGKRILAIVSTARWEPLLRDIPVDCLLFDKLDPPETLQGWLTTDEYLAREDALIERSALVTAITSALDASVRERHATVPTRIVPNGVDCAAFAGAAAAPVPELADVPRPIAGFLGTVAHWVDLELLEACARAYPEWTFPVIGPVNGNVNLAALAALPNVRCIGRVPYARVAATMQAFDVGLMPFRPGEVSDFANPVTLYEFLALGKPVVCTPMTDMDDVTDVIYMSRDRFVEDLRRAADERDPTLVERRRQAAAAHDWTVLVRGMLDTLPL